MGFDKVAYRKNREAGLRGQGELPAPKKPKFLVNKETGKWIGKKRPKAERDAGIEVEETDPGKNMVRTRQGIQLINRKQARRRERDHTAEGKPYTAKGVKPNPQRKEKFSLTLDPTLSNKQRFALRKAQRELRAEEARKEKDGGKEHIQE